jgi:hypothetical protein
MALVLLSLNFCHANPFYWALPRLSLIASETIRFCSAHFVRELSRPHSASAFFHYQPLQTVVAGGSHLSRLEFKGPILSDAFVTFRARECDSMFSCLLTRRF